MATFSFGYLVLKSPCARQRSEGKDGIWISLSLAVCQFLLHFLAAAAKTCIKGRWGGRSICLWCMFWWRAQYLTHNIVTIFWGPRGINTNYSLTNEGDSDNILDGKSQGTEGILPFGGNNVLLCVGEHYWVCEIKGQDAPSGRFVNNGGVPHNFRTNPVMTIH